DNVVAGLDEVAGHWAAHDAQPDEGDGGHDALPSRELPALPPPLTSGASPLPPWPELPLPPWSAPPLPAPASLPPGPARRPRGGKASLPAGGRVALYSSPPQPV